MSTCTSGGCCFMIFLLVEMMAQKYPVDFQVKAVVPLSERDVGVFGVYDFPNWRLTLIEIHNAGLP